MEKAEAFLRPITIIPLGREEAMDWGLIEARLRKEGTPIEAEDGMIGATAHKHGLTLVTGNSKHFGRIKGYASLIGNNTHPKSEPLLRSGTGSSLRGGGGP